MRIIFYLSKIQVTRYFEAKMLHSSITCLDTIAQVTLLLGAVAHFVIGLSGKSCNFILSVVSMLICMSMALTLPDSTEERYLVGQAAILQQLPSSIHQALSYFDLDSSATVYAACPSCNFTHNTMHDCVTTNIIYPKFCTNTVLTAAGWNPCNMGLVEEHQGSVQHPMKSFVSILLQNYLSQLLTYAEAEHLCKKACDDAFRNLEFPPTKPRNIFDSLFLRTFKGSGQNWLFIDGGDAIQLVLSMHVNFFNPNTSYCAATESIGVITLAVMNLPKDLQY